MNAHPNLLSVNDSVLVIIDVQTQLTSVIAEAPGMCVRTAVLLQAAQQLQVPVLVTEQYPQGLGRTERVIISKLPDPLPIYEKTGFSCFSAPGFSDALQATKRKQVIIIGVEAHICVMQTALDFLAMGYQVYIVEDAVCSRKADHKLYALKRIYQQGATITNYESVMFEWLRDANHAEFKTLSRLIR